MKTKNNNRFSPTLPKNPFNLAIKYLSFRPRSVKEMHDYLIKKQYLEDEVNDTIKQLLELKFLNDDDFARTFAENRQRKGKSKKIISFELEMKGISKEITEDVLEFGENDYKTAHKYIMKRLKQFDMYDPEDRKKKIISRLRSRGFDWETISKVLRELEI